MKVLLVTPNFHQPRGNTITVQRIADGLKKCGVETEIISVTEDHQVLDLPTSTIVHGFHAYRFYKFKEMVQSEINSFVITMTGTDLNHDIFDKNRRSQVIACLNEAKAIHVFDHEARQVLLREVPNIEQKVYIIPQGVSDFPKQEKVYTKEKNTFLFVLPAGIRQVKNIPFAIKNLNVLRKKYPNIRLWLVGPVLEDEEGMIVEDLVNQNENWVTYIGQVPHSHMGNIYEEADVVLNTSHSEGQPSSVLEAMQYCLPVLVANNLGNRNIVTHQETGLIYTNESEFLDYAEQLVNNYKLGETFGVAAKQFVDGNHSSQLEVDTLISIYESVLA